MVQVLHQQCLAVVWFLNQVSLVILKLLLLFYSNNLLNLFLYQHFPKICSSLLCDCGTNVKSSFHVASECKPSLASSETIKQKRASIWQLLDVVKYKLSTFFGISMICV